jgi:Tfp pilus assembly protein PilF
MSRAKTLAKTSSQIRKRPTPKKHSKTEPFLTGKSLIAVLCILLAAATIALYSPVVTHSFVVWDDHDYVVANSHVHAGLSWNTIKWAFASTEASNWHPLTWLSHALDFQLFALNPAGHHLDSVLIHALNAVLLFLLLVWGTKRVGPSLLVAALFAVHPLNVESVAWVAERKSVLSTLFFLLAIGAYGWYARKPDWRRYLLVAALFAAGLMAKPMVITLPFVLLLLDYWPLERIAFRSSLFAVRQNAGDETSGEKRTATSDLRFVLLEKVPLLLLSAASAWITVKAQRAGQSVRSLHQFPLGLRIENAVVAYVLYLWKMLWPARLAALYPHSANTLPAWQVVLSALILVGITVLVMALRRKGYLPVGWFWFLGTLIPVIGLVQVGGAAMADRYAYIPLIGIFVMIAWSLDDLAEAKAVSTVWRVFPAVCVLIMLGFVTSRQLSYWENEYKLWAHTVEVTEQNPYAQAVLGDALMNPDLTGAVSNLEGLDTEQKRMDEARLHYEEALKSYRELAQQNPAAYLPDMATTLNEIGNLDRRENRTDEARQNYEEAMQYYHQLAQQNPDPHLVNMATTLSNLAAVDRRENRVDDASRNYEEALKIRRQLAQQDPDKYLPSVVDTLINLGFVERSQKQTVEAHQHFEEALIIGRQLAQQDPDRYLPALANRLINLGNFDTEQNRMDEGRQHYEEALEIYQQLAQQNPAAYLPNVAATLNNLGLLERDQKQNAQAYAHFEEALKVYRQVAQQNPAAYLPETAMVLNNLGKLDGARNRLDDANQNFEGALKIYRQLAQQDPDRYLPDLAGALNNLAFVDRLQVRLEQSRVNYTEAMTIYRKLAQGNSDRYANDLARVEAGLAELERKAPAR